LVRWVLFVSTNSIFLVNQFFFVVSKNWTFLTLHQIFKDDLGEHQIAISIILAVID